MMHYYSEINGVTLTFSGVQNPDGITDEIRVRFERPAATGFDFAEGKLPNRIFYKTCGFSEDELFDLEAYLCNNEPLIWDLARDYRPLAPTN